ncbi:hypothetical protein [Pseudomonas sp. Root562]|uniref:hypothetical protein n=1 Tax=Pseudomonas sp. Root562 TaxID=1736561 RepID=UPI000703A86E|nr:hypothetical protein [Pseudomonas sp. Root562]KQZ80637.1 phage tail protein [Pseudomonas sp. Root562]
MDFPISVPSIGLVNGKFADEDPLGGTPGSLIPAQWGNAVTEELLAVIQAAGLAPDEEDNDQLLQAINQLLAGATPEATATVLGLVKQATQAEAEDGTDTKKSMSPVRVHQAIAKKTAAVVISTIASKVLVANDLGLVLADATASVMNITLPAANAALGVRDVIIRRVDNGGNRLTVTAAGGDKIKFHTHLAPAGYPFFVLMGAGDWWHLRSDGAGSWWPVGRYDNTALGRQAFETTTAFPPGGWGAHHGLIYNRAEWPWVWDHAQASGMLTTEALRAGKEGMWTSGDGASTFRSPEGRGEFVRALDEARGVDVDRLPGSSKLSQNKAHEHGARSFLGLNGTSGSNGLVAYANTGVGSQLPTGAVSLEGGSEGYPRHIAYPGRIKLI